jgi:proteic killer suppression protein
MQVGYGGDKSLEKLCTDEKEMKRKRADIADKLPLRINALRQADNVEHLVTLDPLGWWHQLTGDRAGLWAGRVSKNHRILIRPEGETPGATSVTVTVVAGGEDYH